MKITAYMLRIIVAVDHIQARLDRLYPQWEKMDLYYPRLDRLVTVWNREVAKQGYRGVDFLIPGLANVRAWQRGVIP